MADALRIANSSGFLGDRRAAAREMVDGGPIDILTGDYLAELTMAILARQRVRDPAAGYAAAYLDQLEDVLASCLDRGIKIVSNAGGLNPHGLAARIGALGDRLGLDVTVGTVTGDDLMGELHRLDLSHAVTGEQFADRGVTPVTANAYLGGWGIADALERGADVVVTGRVTDASLVVGPAAWHHGWERDDWDALAGAVVAGHVIECGAHATGGNYSFFAEIEDLVDPGFPIAEVAVDGSAVITKHQGSGGAVTVGTVTAQLLYEIDSVRYLNPDVVARLDSVHLESVGKDRVRISGCRGEPPPPTTKVAATTLGGYRNSVTFLLAGLDVDAKAEMLLDALWSRLGGRESFAHVDEQLLRTDHADPPSHEAAFARLRVTVHDADPQKVGRAFSNTAVELALSSYPGFTMTAPPGRESPLAVYWPTTVVQRASVVTVDGSVSEVPPAPGVVHEPLPVDRATVSPDGGETSTVRAPIGRVVGARSGDKGGDANLGVWARNQPVYDWLASWLTVAKIRELLPETQALQVERHPLPNLRAINFVLRGYLGEGVSSSVRMDPQAKALGEYFRARVVDIPESLLAV